MNREKEILLELLLEKYGTNNVVQVKPKTETKVVTNGVRRRGRNVPTVYSNSRWTTRDVSVVYDRIAEGLSNHEIAKLVGRSSKSIQTLRSHLTNGKNAAPVVRQFLAWKKAQS